MKRVYPAMFPLPVRRALVAVVAGLGPAVVGADAVRSEAWSLAGITDVLVEAEQCRGAHVTTRPHNRKVVRHGASGTWYLFHGTGHWIDQLGDAGLERESIAWRSSPDGVTFGPLVPAVVGNGHSSSVDVLLVGDRVWLTETRFGYWRSRAGIPALVDGKPIWHRDRIARGRPNHHAPYEIFEYNIVDGRLVPAGHAEALPGDRHVGHAGPHYGSLTRDGRGHLWVAARALVRDGGGLAVWVARSSRPDDASQWEPHHVLYASGGPGTLAPQIVALDGGRVACVLFAKSEKMTGAFLYDPETRAWSGPQKIGEGFESKRASAVFDPAARRLHVVYTDGQGDARHRAWSAPYRVADWSPALEEPGALVAARAGVNKGDDDLSLAINPTRQPATLALLHRGPDQRLHLRYHDGRGWRPEDIPIGLQDPAMTCDEVSAVADFSSGLGFAYWCQWADPARREEKNGIGHLRFGLVRNVGALFGEHAGGSR